VQQNKKLMAHSTAMESIQATSDPVDADAGQGQGGMPARNHKGERILIFVGVIDILQSYRLTKKLEHTFKAIIHDGVRRSGHNSFSLSSRTLFLFTDPTSTPNAS
jgi:1-phosphatidylinositol-4-phosphate 5-kinase